MVKKIKWKTLMSQISARGVLYTADILNEITNIDDLINVLVDDNFAPSFLEDLYEYVMSDVINVSDDGIWADMDVYTSSWVEKDKRYIYLLANKLREYIGFYKKVLTDEGVQRHLVYSKEYANDGNSNNVDRNINSDVPQNSNLYDPQHPESNSVFDQAIADYASSIAKNKADATSHTEGTSGTTVSGTTWDEAKKNIQMMFYNELKDFIYSLPERIYSLYSLDTIPAPELIKKMIEHYHEVWDMIHE